MQLGHSMHACLCEMYAVDSGIALQSSNNAQQYKATKHI